MSDQERVELAQFSSWIRESLETLTESVGRLQELVTQLRIAVGGRADSEAAMRAEIKEHRDELKSLRADVTDLKVKAGIIAAIAGAGMTFLLKKLGA